MKFQEPAQEEQLKKTITALEAKGYQVQVVATKNEALECIKKTIPSGATVMNGSSTTLNEIGYPQYVSAEKHGWIDFHARVNAESDPDKRAALRRDSVHAEYYLGSVHALVETGEFIIASNTGSQLPHIVFTSPNLVFVIGSQKIVSTLSEGMQRLNEYVIPKENERMQSLYHMDTTLNKILFFQGDAQYLKRNIQVILIRESAGF